LGWRPVSPSRSALGALFGVNFGHILGLFAGSMTSTATVQAALDVMKNSEPSVGYSVAYPFGVIGPILCFYFQTRKVQPSFPLKPARFQGGEITVERLPEGCAPDEVGILVRSQREVARARAAVKAAAAFSFPSRIRRSIVSSEQPRMSAASFRVRNSGSRSRAGRRNVICLAPVRRHGQAGRRRWPCSRRTGVRASAGSVNPLIAALACYA
jgi:hypothetical protein